MNAKIEGLEGFDDTGFDVPQQDKWQYPAIGYNASDGVFYVDSEAHSNLRVTPFATRQCKEVEDINGMVNRYPIRTRRSEMVEGDITYRTQAIVMVEGELYIFGARSYTAGALWTNPRSGPYHNENFQVGLWYALLDWIKDVKSAKGIQTSPYCWVVYLIPSDKTIKVGSGKNTSMSTPIVYKTPFTFVGKEKAYEYRDLYKEEDLDAWSAEWKKAARSEKESDTGAIGAVEDDLDSIPGFGLE